MAIIGQTGAKALTVDGDIIDPVDTPITQADLVNIINSANQADTSASTAASQPAYVASSLMTPSDAAAFMSSQTMPSGWFTSSDPAYQKALAAGVYSQPQDFYLEGSTTNPYYVADPFGMFNPNSFANLANLSPEEQAGNIFAKYGAVDVAYNPQYGWIGLDAQGNPIREAFVSNANPDQGLFGQLAAMALSIAAPYLGPWAQGAMAAYNASQGNYLGAIAGAAGAAGQLAGAAAPVDALEAGAAIDAGTVADTFGGLTQTQWGNVANAAKAANAIKNNDIGGLLSVAAGTSLGKDVLSTQIGSTGVTFNDTIAAANTISALSNGDYTQALGGLGQLTGSKDTQIVAKAAQMLQAINSGNFGAVSGLANELSSMMGDPSRSNQVQNLTGTPTGPSLPSDIANVPGPVDALTPIGQVSLDPIQQLPDLFPALTEQDLQAIVSQVKSEIPAGVDQATVDNAINLAIHALPQSATPDQVNEAISGATMGLTTQASVDAATNSMTQALADAQQNDASKFASIEQQIADMRAAGLTEADIQDAVNSAVSASGATLSDQFKADINQAIAGSSAEISALRGDVNAQIGDVKTLLLDSLGEQATDVNAKIESLVAQGNTYQQATEQALSDIGLTINDLGADFTTKLGDLSASFEDKLAGATKGLATTSDVNTAVDSLTQLIKDAQGGDASKFSTIEQTIQALRDAGLTEGDVNDIVSTATSGLATTIGELESGLTEKIGGVEAQVSALSQETRDALAQQSETTQQRFDSLTADQQKMADQLVQQGQSFNDAIDSVEADVIAKIEEYSTKTAEDIASLSKDTQNALAVQSEATQKRFDDLTAEQQKQADALVQQGNSFADALDQVESGVLSKIQEYSSQTEQKIAELSTKTQEAFDQQSEETKQQILDLDAAQRQKFDELVQNDVDIQEALNTAQEQTRQEISDLAEAVRNQYGVFTQEQQDLIKQMTDQGTSLEDAINQVSTDIQQQVSEQNTATQAQFAALTKTQQDEVAARVQQGVDIKSAINNVISAMTSQSQATQKAQKQAAAQSAADAYLSNLQTQAAIKKAAQGRSEEKPGLANVFYGKGAVEFGPGAESMAAVSDFQGQKAQAGNAMELALEGKGGENAANDAYTRLMALASQDSSATVDELMRIIGRG